MFECMKNQFAEKWVLIIYRPLWNRFQLMKGCRTARPLESPSGQSDFNTTSILNTRQRTLPTLWGSTMFSSWMCISQALPAAFKCIHRPDKCTQTCIFRTFSFTILALKFFFINFLKVINKDYKPIYLIHFSACVCNIPNTFSFPLFVKCSNFIFQGTFW